MKTDDSIVKQSKVVVEKQTDSSYLAFRKMRILQKSQPKLVSKDVSRLDNNKGSSRPFTTDYYNSTGEIAIRNSSSQVDDAAANSMTMDDILNNTEPVDGLFDAKF